MIGTMLGNRYELLEKIGEGGMAEVYKAKCHLLKRYVAVKILKNQYSDNIEFVDKFKQEASSAASLSHNNIVGIYDIGSQDDINYIVMEYIDGKTLKQIINEQKVINSNTTVTIAIQIAKALECAHNNNIIHRDVKPHNILVTKEGIIKVADFGIAKATSSVTITNSDRIIGSAHYFSPEQAKGNFVDCKTDIYSLGIIMYEMATGKLPYDGESPVSIALKHIQEKAKPPIEVNPNIPEGLNRIILKAIEKEQYKRYQNANDLLVDLEKIKKNPNLDIPINNEENEYTKIMKPITDYKENFQEDSEQDNEENDEEDNVDKSYKNKKGKSKTKKIIIASLIALGIVIMGIVGAFTAVNKQLNGDEKTGKITVPNIIGLSKEDAEKVVKEKGLRFVTTTETSDKPTGVVIECYPHPGTEIDLSGKAEVRATISSGPRVSALPNLIDIEFEAAKEYLKTYNLNIGKVSYSFNDTIDKGKVCDQSPKSGSNIENDTVVDLVISQGKREKLTIVPNLIGKNLDQAEYLLENSKLQLGKVTRISTKDGKKDGLVTVQSIEANQNVKENTVINLSYYVHNKSLVVVPNFRNKTVREAKKLAHDMNLKIKVKGHDDFIIVSQNKSPGREVTEGTVINLKSEPNP